MYKSDTAPWLEFFVWDDDGAPVTDFDSSTTGASIVVQRDNLADSSALSLSDASGPTDWAAGKIHQMGSGNKYRVGIATASISSYDGKISVAGSYTGGVIEGITEIVSGYDTSQAVSDFDAAADEVTTDSASRTASQATGFSTHNAADVWTVVTRTLTGNVTVGDYAAGESPEELITAAYLRTAVGLASANLDTQLSTIDSNLGSVLEDTGTTLPGTLTTIEGKIDTVDSNVDTILGRVTSTVATLWSNLTAMISGSGLTAAFTETALENAPSGAGGGGGDATEENQTTIIGLLNSKVITVETISNVNEGGDITLYVGDAYVDDKVVSIPVVDPGETLKTYWESAAVSSLLFGAGVDSANEITGTPDLASLSHSSGVTYVPVSISAVTANSHEGYTYHLKSVDSDDNGHVDVEGCLTVKPQRATA